MEQCSAQGLNKPSIAKTICGICTCPGSKGIRRVTLLPETIPQEYVWGQGQPASIRQLLCDFFRETPGDVQPLPGKHSFMFIP